MVVFVAAIAVFSWWFWSAGDGSNARTGKKTQDNLASLAPLADARMPERTVQFEDFAGSESCQSCHAAEYRLWKNSTHGRAGGDPREVEIIARFDGKPLRFKDAVVRPRRGAGGKYFFEVNQEGKAPRIVNVDAVVGGGHMIGGGTQSFFTRLPDGSIRFLPFDFIRKESIWFVQLRKDHTWVPIDDGIALDDLAQWEPHRMLGTREGASSCQNCHGSQILLEFDPAKRQYTTRYKTLRINCESCHGPGKRHIGLMTSGNRTALEDIGMEPLETLDKDASLMVCFQCHATKDALKDDFLPGEPLEAYFSLKMPILGSRPFLPDGRVREFAYQLNHLFSDCYVNGSMTCVDCHAPHDQGYRDITGKKLVGKFDNGQCTGCHGSKAINLTAHTRHKPDSEGSLCTSCHMPFLQHRSLGDALVFSRSDHVIPIPRPAFDAMLGIENACQKCHQDKSVARLQQQTNDWYGEIKPHAPMLQRVIRADSLENSAEAIKVLLSPESNHLIGRFAAMVEFIRRYARPDMAQPDQKMLDRLQALAATEDLDTRAFALMALHLTAGNLPEINRFLKQALAGSGEQEMILRRRWALAMDFMGSHYSSKGAFRDAIASHQKALEIYPDDAFAWQNLGSAWQRSGNNHQAIRAYLSALEVDPYRTQLYFRTAQLQDQNGNRPAAIKTLRTLLKYQPDNQQARQILAQLQANPRSR